MANETKLESVFICLRDETVIVKDSQKETCPICDDSMENAGWFESAIESGSKEE